MSCGIYKITNKINNKIYIGQSRKIEQRWQREKHNYLNKNARQSKLDKAIAEYGIENFTFEIIELCDISSLDEREKYWIKYFNSFDDGYNATRGGSGASFFQSLTQNDVEQIKILLKTTELTNIEIASKFDVSENTICGINTGYYWFMSDETYPIRKKKQKIDNYCIDCGKKIDTKATRCKDCSDKARRKVSDRPNKETLSNLLFLYEGNFTKVASLFNITDNAVRRWCKKYNLPYHSGDYRKK